MHRVVLIGAFFLSAALAQDLAQLRTNCHETKDPMECIKYRAMDFFQQAASQPIFKVMEGVEVVKSEKRKGDEGEPRGLVESLEQFVEEHELRVELPQAVGGGTLTLSPKELDADKLTITLAGPEDQDNQVEQQEPRRRRLKLRKLIVPLLVFVLLKAMTLIPVALGVLGIKAWNALQLSFFSFVTSLAVAIFQLVKKVASDGAVPVAAHAAWDPYHYSARNFFNSWDEAQNLAYSAYQ